MEEFIEEEHKMDFIMLKAYIFNRRKVTDSIPILYLPMFFQFASSLLVSHLAPTNANILCYASVADLITDIGQGHNGNIQRHSLW